MSKNIQVGKIFNKFAYLYGEVSNQYTISRRYKIATLQSKGKLLDIGGASGLFVKYLPSEIDSCVLDISFAMCKEAKRNNVAQTVCADAESLPFKSNSFDSVASLEMIYYLENPVRFLTEVERILKADGTLTLSFYNSKLNLIVRFRSLLRKLKLSRMFFDDGNPSFTSLEEFYQYLKLTNLEIIKIESIVFFPFKYFHKINLFLEQTFLKNYALFNVVSLKKIN